MLRRYFRLHFQNLGGALGRLLAQPVAAGLNVLVLAIALALPAGMQILVNNARTLSAAWEGAADFTVYLDMDIGDDAARDVSRRIADRPDVESTRFVDRDDAYADFKARSGFGDALDALNENPLPHTIIVRPAGGAVADIEALAAALDAYDETALVQLDTEWVARLRSMLVLFGRIVDITTALLAAAVVLVIGNTIRLEINNRRTEIEVMKLVGGTDGFIRRPFLYMGFCYGLIGAIVAALVLTAALALIQGPVRELAELYAARFELEGLSFGDAGLLLAGGALLGWGGAWLAAARHLAAIEPT